MDYSRHEKGDSNKEGEGTEHYEHDAQKVVLAAHPGILAEHHVLLATEAVSVILVANTYSHLGTCRNGPQLLTVERISSLRNTFATRGSND